MGLSDLPESSEARARRVAFCVGDLMMLDETSCAWKWAKQAVLHDDDNVFVLHCRPVDPLSQVYFSDSESTWLPAWMRDDLAKRFHLHTTCLLKPPVGKEITDSILEYLLEHKVELLVMGSRDISKAEQWLLGSTSKVLVANSPCPCVVIRRPKQIGFSARGPEVSFTRPRHVAFAVNHNEKLSAQVVKWSIEHLLLSDDLITVISCVNALGDKNKRKQILYRLVKPLEAFKSQYNPAAEIDIQVIEGNPGPALTESISKAQPEVDLLVVGSRGLKGIRRAFSGSVSSFLLDHVECPLCVCRQTKADA